MRDTGSDMGTHATVCISVHVYVFEKRLRIVCCDTLLHAYLYTRDDTAFRELCTALYSHWEMD